MQLFQQNQVSIEIKNIDELNWQATWKQQNLDVVYFVSDQLQMIHTVKLMMKFQTIIN